MPSSHATGASPPGGHEGVSQSRWFRKFTGAGRVVAACLAMLVAAGCSAIYPEVSTPVRPYPLGRELEPPPPRNVLHIAFRRVEIPKTTRDGRKWDTVGGDAPDPYGIVYVGDKELFRTPVQSNTFTPTWPKAPKTNYELPKNAKLRIEIWDDNAIHRMPICTKEVKNLVEHSLTGEVSLLCNGGARIELVLKPGDAKLGLGFSYEFRSDGVYVTDVMPLSPAFRAGLREKVRIVRVMGQPVRGKSEDEVKSLINANAATGVQLAVRGGQGDEHVIDLKEGPIYPKGN